MGFSSHDAGAFRDAMHCNMPEAVSVASIDPEAARVSIDEQVPQVEHNVSFQALLKQLGLISYLDAFEEEGCARSLGSLKSTRFLCRRALPLAHRYDDVQFLRSLDQNKLLGVLTGVLALSLDDAKLLHDTLRL